MRVYEVVYNIPVGQVRTYGWVAKQIGKPGAARAVGNALNKNPFPIIVPCHRVVAKNGLGGYSGGIKLKRKLLESEVTCKDAL
ncbi:MAG: MGMT family protein [Candidatus Margulisbacteria bacterium]|nr:MGMT family protein [Candidatus Margulisiibacteriota bacterium]